MELKNLEAEGFPQPGSWRSSERLSSSSGGQRDGADESTGGAGLSFPPSDFFLEILKVYGLQPHNISPNSVLAISNHVTLCEGHLRVTPELSLFQYYFTVKKERIRQSTELATCGSITFMIRPGRVYPPTDRHESARYWSGGFFYLKVVSDPASTRKLPPFKNCPATELPAWSYCPHLYESPQLTRAVRRICKLTEEGLTGKDLTLSWFTKRIQPLQHRDHDVPLEALEESELETLLRVPSTGNTDPEAASEAEAHEAPRPAKRKRPAPSSPAAKRAREVLSTAATRKAEAEKKRLKLINTSNKGQPAIQHFFKPSGSGSQPPKAPRVLKKKVKPSPASVPVTPEVEVPPKASSTSKPDPKDVINLDDLPEDPTDHGDSAKGASLSAPPQDQPGATFAEPTEEEYEKKVKLIQAANAIRVDPRPTQSLQKLTLAQRHAEVSAMLNKVWGKPDEEMQELTDRRTITEIEGCVRTRKTAKRLSSFLRPAFMVRDPEETAKHSKFDELSAKVKVLEAENESLKTFIKESSNKENEARKELSEKHARDLADLNDKLKKNQNRVTSLVSKNKVLEAEAEAIDKLIFPSLGFEWSQESNLKRTEAYDEVRTSIGALFEACRGIAKTLSLKKAKTSVIDTMTQLMEQVPDFIKDWQKSSARESPPGLSHRLTSCTQLCGCCARSSKGFRHGRHPLGPRIRAVVCGG
ncbi:hypothetical protein QYE76_025276 [Lolium multiflorum]|uniref:Transposase (putative) gypsy type domain-containing protein n=1 Tax=Lolium multiflorum TaxID=4521 RepID=A0AAD8VUI4_LOLMU|nr:hypothetical protein QYE76_025276 [Lolium multiflorum]